MSGPFMTQTSVVAPAQRRQPSHLEEIRTIAWIGPTAKSVTN